MDALLDLARDIWEGQIDFHGQYNAELLTTTLLILSGTLAFLTGFVSQDIYKTLYIGLAGTALTFLVVVPQWPFYNKKPEKWLPARIQRTSGVREGVDLGGVGIEVDGQRVG